MSSPHDLKRILVADDDPIFLDLFRQSLKRSEFEIVAVGNGAAAMLYLESQRFDLAVIDIQMPIIDGLRLIALIRATPRLRDLPIAVITSMREPQVREDCLQTGASDVMTKPVDWAVLRGRLERIMLPKIDRPLSVSAGAADRSDREIRVLNEDAAADVFRPRFDRAG